MSRAGNIRSDEEQGLGESTERTALPGVSGRPLQPQQDEHPEIGMSNRNDLSRSLEELNEQNQDFDDDANDLWFLFGKEAKSRDEAIKTLKDDMDGILIYAGLLSAVLAAFVVPKIQDLKVNPANQSVFYQNQSVQILDRISQQLASVGSENSTNFTPPSPYPKFHASATDRRVNIFWLISLVCSLSAAVLATLVRQWVRVYIHIFQSSSNPLKTARIRQFLFEGTERLPMVAEAVPGLIHISVILFFWGLGDIILHIDKAVFVATVVPITVCVCLYLYCMVAPIWNPQLPYRTPFSGFIWYLMQKLYCCPCYNYFCGTVVKPTSLEVRQEQTAMQDTRGRMDRDVRAVQWLAENINGSNETETFVLSIPGSFNQEWGRNVWREVVREDQPTSPDSQIHLHPGLSSPHEGTTVRKLGRSVRYVLETYSNGENSMDTWERRRRMRGCVEAAASLVCCAGVELGLFGEVGEVLRQLSALGEKERTNEPSTASLNPSFTVRWTCLSLVAIWKMINDNRLQELAKFALDGIKYLQQDYAASTSVASTSAASRYVALTDAQRIDNYLKKAWESVEDLLLAFEPLESQDMTKTNIKGILNSCEASISALERIAIEAVGLEDIDWRISLLQEVMDKATKKLMRHLPGVSFSELKPVAPILISEAFDLSSFESTPFPSRLIFFGQQIQSLCTLGQRLRDIIEDQNTEMHEETLKSLRSLREIPIVVRRPNHIMKRQLWRLLDLNDGDGLGFTIELFFLAVRQLSSASLSDELKKEFFTGTFTNITSNWEKSKNSDGTQRVLLDLLCDLVIPRRGVFSDHAYSPYIVNMLLDLVGKMVKGHGGEPHISEVIQELRDFDTRNVMDGGLGVEALRAIGPPSDPASL